MTQFPNFKPLELHDLQPIQERLWAYQPQTSELNFVNLFIWRGYYHIQWAVYEDWLLFLCHGEAGEHYGLQPIGPASRLDVTRVFMAWLRAEHGVAAPRLERVDARFAAELAGAPDFTVTPTREHFDYVYPREALATLSGRKYSAKRNHINAFVRDYTYAYEPLSAANVAECVEMACIWCQMHRCEDDLSLMEEREAVREALEHFTALPGLTGGVIRIGGKVEAFTLGERLNETTAVIHIEKANPDIRGLYPLINREFAARVWGDVAYINREQDLGEPGLRHAKESYYPEFMVEKFRVTGVAS